MGKIDPIQNVEEPQKMKDQDMRRRKILLKKEESIKKILKECSLEELDDMIARIKEKGLVGWLDSQRKGKD